MNRPRFYFFIGTEAELIKLFPVLRSMQTRKIPFEIIASGQNNLQKSVLFRALGGIGVSLALSDEATIRKSAAGLLKWFLQTYSHAKKDIRRRFPGTVWTDCVMIVHGDTVSTVMGALVAKRLKMKVAHIEAGLRSHNWLSPFPEEIDRVFTSRMADVHFAPGQDACRNLRSVKGLVVDTQYNTILDSLRFSESVPCEHSGVAPLLDTDYFVFVLHRQENLAQKAFVRDLLSLIFELSKRVRCVMILHAPTKAAFAEMGLWDRVMDNPNVTVFPRVDYFDFMKLLMHSSFVITDGGSNQEELSYMGKPCYILRRHTERTDGLGVNALLYDGDLASVARFAEDYDKYRTAPLRTDQSPSERIVVALLAYKTPGMQP